MDIKLPPISTSCVVSIFPAKYEFDIVGPLFIFSPDIPLINTKTSVLSLIFTVENTFCTVIFDVVD